MAGRDRAADDLLALGEVDAALGLEPLAQLDVAQVDVVAQPRRRTVVESMTRPPH